MIQITRFDKKSLPSPVEENLLVQFLFNHLEQYGDAEKDIQAALNYALAKDDKPGGFILVYADNENILSVAVILDTQMSGFIPDHILVYIATHPEARGKGIGRKVMKEIIEQTKGDIALHVDSDNPARILYEKMGFTTPYLEMRLKK